MLTFHLLRAFVTLARHERYAAAAQELGVSQATLSAQIGALERHLGLPLFEQIGPSTRPTGAGRELLSLARETVAVLDEATLAMRERAGLQELGATPVRLAADTTVGIYVLPQVLGTLKLRHPQLRVELEIANRAGVIAQLQTGGVDLALPGQPPDLPDLEVTPYLAHELVAFAAADHPLAGGRPVAMARFLSEPLVVREQGSGTRRTIEDLCAVAGVRPRVALELGHNGAVKAAVAAGLGVGVISSVALTREVRLARLALLEVEGFPLPRRWHIVRLRTRRLSAAAALVLAFLRDQREP